MKTWFIISIVSLFLPLIMLFIGIIFIKKAPNKINPIYGYRSRRSMKSPEAWKFAHFLCGKIWLYAGIVMLLLTILAMLLVLNKSQDTQGLVGTITLYVQLAVMILSLIPIEVALKRNFDENGNKKSPKN